MQEGWQLCRCLLDGGVGRWGAGNERLVLHETTCGSPSTRLVRVEIRRKTLVCPTPISAPSSMPKTIEHVPTFSPTEAEFAKPLEYFTKLLDAGKTYGIVRIITPRGWRPDRIPKTQHETFDSYRQAIHALRSGREFGTGEDYTFKSYRAYADQLKEKWIKAHPDLKLDLSAYVVDEMQMQKHLSNAIEDTYWDIVEGKTKEKMEVDYASNHMIQSEPPNHKWTLSSLIQEKGNVLKQTGIDIPGVTCPWLYFGCLFSTFCWHVEDHFMYSINYLHDGDPKVWYGIPSSCADDFEECMTSRVSTRSMKSDVLKRLTMMVSPFELPKSVHVFKAVQHPGDLVLTFPRAFHAGYNEGWNCAEAVNFAMMDWVMFGQKAVRRCSTALCRKPPLFSHDKLLWLLLEEATALKSKERKRMPVLLTHALIDACKAEIQARQEIRRMLYRVRQVVPKHRWKMEWESWACKTCDVPLFFSYVSCACRVDKTEVLCLHHALQSDAFSCGCVPHLCLEKTDAEINGALKRAKSGQDASSSDEE